MKAAALIGLATAFSTPLFSASVCVGPSSSGSGDGSDWSNVAQWSSLSFARGNTYYLQDGSYAGKTFSTATSGTTTITVKKATASDHGTDTGWSSTYGDGVATFSSQFTFSSSYWVIDGQTGGGPSNWTNSFGFVVTETGDTAAVLNVGNGTTANNLTLRHIEVIGKGSVATGGGSLSNDGIAIYGDANITLSYYYMHGIGRCPHFVSSGGGVVFEYGYIADFYGSAGVHSCVGSLWGFAGTMGDITFRFNVFTSSTSTGGLMWDNVTDHNAKLWIYGNVFYNGPDSVWDNNGNGLIGGWAGGNGEDCYGLRVYNNTFVNVTGRTFTDFIIRSGDNEAKNNLFYNCDSPSYADIQTHDYNYYINSGGAHSEANGTSASSGDPFTDYIHLNFQLTAATSAGENTGSPNTTDALGTSRGADGVWDRGAFEFQAGGSSATYSTVASGKMTLSGKTTIQ